MGVILEVKSGPLAGKSVGVLTGHTLLVGRAAGRAHFALPHDTFMSGVHFAVECAAQGCHVQDRKSSNGTFLNGARIREAMLANGDEIKSGGTVFGVKIVPDAKIAALLPPEDLAPHAAPGPQPPAGEPAPPPPVAEKRPRVAEPAPPPPPIFEDQPRAAAPAPPSAPAAKPSVSKQAPQSVPSSSRRDPASANPAQEIQPPRVSENTPRAGAGGGAKSARVSEPRAGVAPFIAEEFADRPGAADAGHARGFAFSVMGWSFPAAPANWQVQEGFGLQRAGESEFPSSVAATEEALAGITLQQFVESQISMLRGYLRDPKIEPTMPPQVDGADEVMGMDVRHATKDGTELAYRHIYARSNSSVGILTVTTLAAEFPKVIESLQPILDGAAFRGRSE